MKKIICIMFMFIIVTCSMAFAEASFDQIQQLIKNKEYSAATNDLAHYNNVNLLKPVFKDGVLLKEVTLAEIRNRI